MTSINQYFIDEAENGMGSCLVLTGRWSDSFKSVMDKENISVLRLSQSAGWDGNDISFIKRLPDLRGIEIYSWEVNDITPLEALTNLEYLGLQCKFTKAPDFSKFHKLKICKLLWRPKARTVFACDGLSLLNIVNYPSEDLKDIQKMSGLKRLQLTSRKLVSLSGIENLSSLSILDLAECSKLESLSSVDMCQQIEVVEIEGCKKLYDVALLGEINNLKEIVLNDCGNIKSLRSLAKCQLLENITFVGDTSIEDGDLTSLLDIPTLKKIFFVDKRHYSHKQEQVVEILS
ncbi:hypothetical protein L1D15_19725 [Vibrio sp. Isolate25]|uniref:hypothetical protein n=1 Tax=Vibrio sp. Isolate25 TaxID=2908535 RepID=UPI001EFDBC83|nr:hypothetical protein [Vibrio sp. Isolate25]MCG9598927.1 hypothetical protein [Vibrio sp. Isolate25]